MLVWLAGRRNVSLPLRTVFRLVVLMHGRGVQKRIPYRRYVLVISRDLHSAEIWFESLMEYINSILRSCDCAS
jgi:hypothetical protein